MFNVIFFISKSEDLNPEITYTFFSPGLWTCLIFPIFLPLLIPISSILLRLSIFGVSNKPAFLPIL